MTTIGLADLGGLPVSTTHVLSSGVAGTIYPFFRPKTFTLSTYAGANFSVLPGAALTPTDFRYLTGRSVQ